MKLSVQKLFIVASLMGMMSFGVLADDAKPAGAETNPKEVAKAYKKVSAHMHHDMMVDYTGDADADFVDGMIPHHQGAIDMAEIELKYGKDPEIRKLAQGVVDAQKAEIAQMQSWKSKNEKP